MATRVDMKSTPKTRVQRRVEKKQATLLVVLVAVIAVASFALGVIVGRNSVETVAQQVEPPRRIVVAETPPPPVAQQPDEQQAATKPEDEKLTFYDTLSKEEPAPLGSGINLPPGNEEAAPEPAAQTSASAAVTPSTETTEVIAEVKAQAPPPPVAEPQPEVPIARQVSALPAITKGGGWVVQVFASKSAADAGTLRDKLSAKGYPAFITEADLGNKGIWYRVLFGPYVDKDTAVQAQQHAEKKDQLKGFAKRR